MHMQFIQQQQLITAPHRLLHCRPYQTALQPPPAHTNSWGASDRRQRCQHMCLPAAPQHHPLLQQQQMHHPRPSGPLSALPQQQQQQWKQQQQQRWKQPPCSRQQLMPRHTASPVTAAAAAGAAAGDGAADSHQEQAAAGTSSSSGSSQHRHGGQQQQQQQQAAKTVPPRVLAAADEQTYSLRDTQILVETAMLSAVSGLAFLLSTLLKLDNSLGYFLPLPITIAACRNGVAAGWQTMMATAFLLLVLLGPLRAATYVLMHGVLAASLGGMWVWGWPWQASIPAGAVLRMSGQLAYLVLGSLTMNENLFTVMLVNVHNLLDQLSAALGSYGSASMLATTCMIFALLLVNGVCYVFLLHVVYHVILSSMGYKLGPLPGFVRKYLYAGVPAQPQPKPAA